MSISLILGFNLNLTIWLVFVNSVHALTVEQYYVKLLIVYYLPIQLVYADLLHSLV